MDGDERFDFPTPPEEFLKYPKHKVIGLMDDSDSVRQAIDDLVREGFAKDDISVLSGPAGAERLDVDGRHHGVTGRIYRLFERANDTWELLQRHRDHMARNGFGVSVSADRDNKAEAAAILLKYGAHDTAYFGSAHWESIYPRVTTRVGQESLPSRASSAPTNPDTPRHQRRSTPAPGAYPP